MRPDDTPRAEAWWKSSVGRRTATNWFCCSRRTLLSRATALALANPAEHAVEAPSLTDLSLGVWAGGISCDAHNVVGCKDQHVEDLVTEHLVLQQPVDPVQDQPTLAAADYV